MNDRQWIVLGGGAFGLLILIELGRLWQRDRGAFWATLGVPAGLSWCLCTGLGLEFTAWAPDLAGLAHGWGYVLGGGVAAFAFAGGAFHQ